jgi:hypothetical protein
MPRISAMRTKPPLGELGGVTSHDFVRCIAAKSKLFSEFDRAAPTVRKPLYINLFLMYCPEVLFCHSGRRTAEGV